MTVTAWVALVSIMAMVAIWLGYPAIVWVLAQVMRDGPRPDHAFASGRTVTAIVATRDRAELIRNRVANLFDTAHAPALLNVIVAIDAEGAQSTASELQDMDARVRVVTGDLPGGKATALNAAVRAATGEILVLTDTQQRFDERTIPELVAALGDHRFGAISGALALGGDGRSRSPVHYYWALEKRLRHGESCIQSTVGVTGAVYAMRRSLWPVIPPGTLLDDVFVPMSIVLAGHRVGFTYAARAFDVRAFDPTGEGTRKTRTLTGNLQLCRLLPDILSVRRNPIVVQFVAHKLLRLLTPVLAVIASGALAVLSVQWLLLATMTTRAAVVLACLALFAIPASRRRLLALWRWAWELQLATTRALTNAVRGRWTVWR